MTDVGSERDRPYERTRSAKGTTSAARTGATSGTSRPSGAEPPARDEPEEPEENPVHDVLADIAQLKAWGRHLLAAKLDNVKLKLRHVTFLVLFALVGLTTGAALMVTGAVLLLSGLAEAVGTWLESPWLGKVLVAAVFFGVLSVVVLVVWRGVVARFHRHLQKKYDALHARQRIHHGVDVEQRAHELAREEKHGG